MKKSLISILPVLMLSSCGSMPFNSTASFSGSSSSQITISESSTSEEREIEELEVNFVNDKSAIDLSTNITEMKKFISLFGENLVSLECEKLYLDMGGLKFASSNGNGLLTLNFSKTITKLEISMKTYTKYIQYTNTYNCDTPELYINEYNMNLEIVENELSKYNNYILELGDYFSNTIIIESKNGRTIVESIKFYYF